MALTGRVVFRFGGIDAAREETLEVPIDAWAAECFLDERIEYESSNALTCRID